MRPGTRNVRCPACGFKGAAVKEQIYCPACYEVKLVHRRARKG